MIDLDDLTALFAISHPLPWVAIEAANGDWSVDNDGSHPGTAEDWSGNVAEISYGPKISNKERQATAELIAKGVSSLPEMIKELTYLRAVVKRARENYCQNIGGSSRTCEFGSKACIVRHTGE